MLHDIIKIKYVKEGYLPNYPPHLISDEEMCDAFLVCPDYNSSGSSSGDDICGRCCRCTCKCCCCNTNQDSTVDDFKFTDDQWEEWKSSTEISYFKDNYPLIYDKCNPDDPINAEIEGYYRTLVENILYHLIKFKSSDIDTRTLPDWVYSYMLGAVISVNSNQMDKHDLFVPLGVDNIEDTFDCKCAQACYKVSKLWVSKLFNLDHRPPTIFGEPHVLKSIRLDQLSSGEIIR